MAQDLFDYPKMVETALRGVVREALARLLPAQGIQAAPVVGGYWTRSNDVEIDIVGADRGPVAKELLFLGSVKWLETAAFDEHDLVALQRHRGRVTELPDTPAVRGMIEKVHHLVRIVDEK